MKSNICKIENGTGDLEAILKESQRVAEYNGLNHKQTLQLRLLCEEIDGMLPNIIDDFEGELWIDYNEGVCKVNVSISIPEITAAKREELIAVSKAGRNAAAVGISGRIRHAIESFILDQKALGTVVAPAAILCLTSGYSDTVDYASLWTLEGYKSTLKKEDQVEAWDELEKSVIANLADDVIVGIKGNRADLILIKKFA